MAIQLITEVLDNAPPDLTPAELVVLIVIAERANVRTRMAFQSTDPARKRWVLAERARLSTTGLRTVLQRLAARGIEVRVARGKDASGRLVFAHRGAQTTYQLPRFGDALTSPFPEKGDALTSDGDVLTSPNSEKGDALTSPYPSVRPLPSETVKDPPTPRKRGNGGQPEPHADDEAVLTSWVELWCDLYAKPPPKRTRDEMRAALVELFNEDGLDLDEQELSDVITDFVASDLRSPRQLANVLAARRADAFGSRRAAVARFAATGSFAISAESPALPASPAADDPWNAA